MKKSYQQFSDLIPGWCHVYPHAGLPNEMGGYDEDPEIFGTNLYGYAKDGLLNFVGSCCGTFSLYTNALISIVKDGELRVLRGNPCAAPSS